MKKYYAMVAVLMLCMLWEVSAFAQEVKVEELKAKGATVLSADDVKTLLTGATVRYENDVFETQMKLNASGSLDGNSKRRVGSTGGGASFGGDWKVTDAGRWCGQTRVFGQGGGGASFCRDIIKLGDKYYYAVGNPKNDARPAVEMRVSK